MHLTRFDNSISIDNKYNNSFHNVNTWYMYMYRPGFVTPLPVPESTLVGLAVGHLGVPCTRVVLNATVYVTATTKGLCHKTQTSMHADAVA